MSTTTAAAIPAADARDAFATTRANYERFALLLLRAGHVPTLSLSHLDFRVLLFLLAQKPGHYAAHHRTIATACGSNPTSIKQSLGRLRAAGLVLWELIPPHHALPSGRYTRTNVNRYWVHLPRLGALLDAPPTRPHSDASTRPNSASSYGTRIFNEQPPPTTPPPAPSEPVRPPEAPRPPDEGEAVLPIDVGSEIAPICESWNKLGLGDLDRRSVRALENRVAEGATIEQLEAAVDGAGVDEWLRRRAKVPFAVVFATLVSIERFAHEGRKIRDARELAERRETEESRKDREWRTQQRQRASALAIEPPPTADELRQLLPAPPPVLPVPLSAEQFARRREHEKARLEAWSRENGLAE